MRVVAINNEYYLPKDCLAKREVMERKERLESKVNGVMTANAESLDNQVQGAFW